MADDRRGANRGLKRKAVKRNAILRDKGNLAPTKKIAKTHKLTTSDRMRISFRKLDKIDPSPLLKN